MKVTWRQNIDLQLNMIFLERGESFLKCNPDGTDCIFHLLLGKDRHKLLCTTIHKKLFHLKKK